MNVTSLFRQFVFLNILDGLTTYAGIARSVGHEVNLIPALVFFYAARSPGIVVIAMKLFSIAVGTTLCVHGSERWLLRLNAVFYAVVTWNCIVLAFG